MNRFSSAAAAALLALPLAVPAVQAQDATTGNGSTSGSDGMATGTPGSGSGANGAGSDAASDGGSPEPAANTEQSGAGDTAGTGPDRVADLSTVVVSVGDTDITAGQVRDMLASMPPQMQTQPMELLVPLAVEELVMRELVLQKARSEGLGNSTEVQNMADGGDSENALEDAMIRTYIGERMEGAVTDEAVQSAYGEAAASTEQEIPPLEEVRPQIEQQLQQRRLIEIRDELKSEIEVVYYGPDGEPRDHGASGMTTDGASAGEGSSTENSDSAGGNADAEADATTGSGQNSGSSGSTGSALSGSDPSSEDEGGTAPGSGSSGESGESGSNASTSGN